MNIVVVVTALRAEREGPPCMHQRAFGPYNSWQAASAVATRLCAKGFVAHSIKLDELMEEGKS
jgi:hypothetical protein